MKFDIRYNVAKLYEDPNGRKSIIAGETEGKSFSGDYDDQADAVAALYANEGNSPNRTISIISISSAE